MSLVRRVARPLLAAAFVFEGVQTIRKPAARAEIAEGFSARVARPLGIEENPDTIALLVKANAGVQIAGGALLATGRLPRLAAAVLALSVTATTISRDAFWAGKTHEERAAKGARFVQDVGLLGGVLLAAVDTDGRPSLGWRARRAGKQAKKAAKQARKSAEKAKDNLAEQVHDKLPI